MTREMETWLSDSRFVIVSTDDSPVLVCECIGLGQSESVERYEVNVGSQTGLLASRL